MYSLQSVHGQFVGIHVLIFVLKLLRVPLFLISAGTMSHILGAKYDILLSPYLVVRTLCCTNEFTFLRLYVLSFILNNSDIRAEDKLLIAL